MEQPPTVRFGDIIRPYDGQGDFAEWLERLEHVASLQAVADRARFLPLFLTGGAFSVYQTIVEQDKQDYKKVREALLQAFAVNSFQAYEQLMTRKLGIDEHVDVYASAVKRLVSLVRGKPDDILAKHAFVAGLPEGVRHQLHAACSLTDMTLAEVIAKARTLVARTLCLATPYAAAAAAARTPGPHADARSDDTHERRPTREQAVRSRKSRRACFVCGAETHLAAACPDRKAVGPKNV